MTSKHERQGRSGGRRRTVILVYPEQLEQCDQIRRVNELAFGRSNEVALVHALRAFEHISLVAEEEMGAGVLGNVFFTPELIENEGRVSIGGLVSCRLTPGVFGASSRSQMKNSWCWGLDRRALVGLGGVVRYRPEFAKLRIW